MTASSGLIAGVADVARIEQVPLTQHRLPASTYELLRQAATVLSGSFRGEDVIARIGGDEFVVILVHIDAEGLFSSAEKLRTLVGQSAFFENNEQIHVTVSIGATLVQDTDTTETMMQRADALMYRSKKTGCNKVSID